MTTTWALESMFHVLWKRSFAYAGMAGISLWLYLPAHVFHCNNIARFGSREPGIVSFGSRKPKLGIR